MFFNTVTLKNRLNPLYRSILIHRRLFSADFDSKYSEIQKNKILEVINQSDVEILSKYDLTKTRLKKFMNWKNSNGQMKTLSDIELVEGFTDKTAKKLFDSILEGPRQQEVKLSNKIKGQILQPSLSDEVIKDCRRVLTVYITVKSVCWTLLDKDDYEVMEWEYYNIDYPEKKFQITDILDISWRLTQELPEADIYVMKAESTTLRSAGSDPNNPKVIAVNLQKAQMVSMIVALINARSNSTTNEESSTNNFKHKVYFLRPTLPFRLYGTLVGNEKVSTDQTIENILRSINEKSTNNSHVYIPESLKSLYRSKNELEKDMLGHCLLLGLTFMDLCIYKNKESINKLMNRLE